MIPARGRRTRKDNRNHHSHACRDRPHTGDRVGDKGAVGSGMQPRHRSRVNGAGREGQPEGGAGIAHATSARDVIR